MKKSHRILWGILLFSLGLSLIASVIPDLLEFNPVIVVICIGGVVGFVLTFINLSRRFKLHRLTKWFGIKL